MEIIDLLNSGEVALFEYNDYFKEDKSLIDFELYKISVASPISYPHIDEINVLNHYISQIRSEIRNFIDKKIIKELENSYEYEVIDLRESGYRLGNELCNYIKTQSDYIDVMSNARICSYIQDSNLFSTLPFKNASNNTNYIVGSVGDKDIYVNPYFRYNDTRLYLFNTIKVNIGEFIFDIVSEATFGPRIVIEIPISLRVSESKTIFIRDEDLPDLHPDLISKIRDKKIDDILDE
jgi:hypothetical protein